MSAVKINVKTHIASAIHTVWNRYTEPDHIIHWNFASNDWHCPTAENDLRPGGKLKSRMEAKDGSFGFDFEATYDTVIPNQLLEYTLGDGRKVSTRFVSDQAGVMIETVFDAEMEHPVEMQAQGWQAILDHFKKYTERSAQ
jgi:uncharacterized protein YndB with AHSA1/START domain